MIKFDFYFQMILTQYITDKRDEGYDVNDIMFQFCTNEELIDILTLTKWSIYASIQGMHEWIDEKLKVEFKKSDGKYVYNDNIISHIVGLYAYCVYERKDFAPAVFFMLPPILMLNSELEYLLWDKSYEDFAVEYFSWQFLKGNKMREEFKSTDEYKKLMELSTQNGWGFDESRFIV